MSLFLFLVALWISVLIDGVRRDPQSSSSTAQPEARVLTSDPHVAANPAEILRPLGLPPRPRSPQTTTTLVPLSSNNRTTVALPGRRRRNPQPPAARHNIKGRRKRAGVASIDTNPEELAKFNSSLLSLCNHHDCNRLPVGKNMLLHQKKYWSLKNESSRTATLTNYLRKSDGNGERTL